LGWRWVRRYNFWKLTWPDCFFKNLGGYPPKWAAPKLLKADGKIIRIRAGKNGSIQGPAEANWGYTVPSVADWNNDGLPDIVINSIWGKIMWYENVGARTDPKLATAKHVKVAWNGPSPKPAWNWWNPKDNNLVTQWRTTPAVVDLNHDGLPDLVMLDQQGYLSYFKRVLRNGKLILLPGKRIFSLYHKHGKLRLNSKTSGGSGRRKFVFTDWDNDEDYDLLVNSKNVNFYENISGSSDSSITFLNMGELAKFRLAGHTTSPTVVDWNKDGIPDLLIGAEDGHFYYLQNPRSDAIKKASSTK
jgi:hypothetical protein